MNSPASTRIGRRVLAAIATSIAVTLFAIGATAASADPPPAAAGNTSHGFMVDHGVVTTIDHPKATTIPAAAGRAGGHRDHGHQRSRPGPGRLPGPRPGHPPLRARPQGPLHKARGSAGRKRLRRVRRHQQPRRDGRVLQRRPGSHDHRLPAYQERTVRRYPGPGRSDHGGVEDQRPATGRGPLRRRRRPARPGRHDLAGRDPRLRLARRRLQDHRRPGRRRNPRLGHQQPRADGRLLHRRRG